MDLNKLLKNSTIKEVYKILPRGKKKKVILSLTEEDDNIDIMIERFEKNICNMELVADVLDRYNLDKNEYLLPITNLCSSFKIKEENIIKSELGMVKKEAEAIKESLKEKSIEPIKKVYKKEDEIINYEIEIFKEEIKQIIKKLETLDKDLQDINAKLELITYKNIFIEYFKNIEKKLRKIFNFKSVDDAKKECKKEYETFKKNHY